MDKYLLQGALGWAADEVSARRPRRVCAVRGPREPRLERRGGRKKGERFGKVEELDLAARLGGASRGT